MDPLGHGLNVVDVPEQRWVAAVGFPVVRHWCVRVVAGTAADLTRSLAGVVVSLECLAP